MQPRRLWETAALEPALLFPGAAQIPPLAYATKAAVGNSGLGIYLR